MLFSSRLLDPLPSDKEVCIPVTNLRNTSMGLTKIANLIKQHNHSLISVLRVTYIIGNQHTLKKHKSDSLFPISIQAYNTKST